MQKLLIGAGVVALVLVGIFFLMKVTVTNGIVRSENAVDQAWADVEAAYQRRLDTLPKFVKTVQFSADFQLKLQKDYAQAREGIKEAAQSGNPETLQQAANDKFNAMLIVVRQEAVPEAKTDQLTELNAQIENVERVINHERNKFNAAVKAYNDKIETWPGSMFSGSREPKEGFHAQQGAEESPEIDLKLK
jgi:LemA protein